MRDSVATAGLDTNTRYQHADGIDDPHELGMRGLKSLDRGHEPCERQFHPLGIPVLSDRRMH